MPTVHFLNVGNGDCSVIQHGSGRVTMIDICGGNMPPPRVPTGPFGRITENMLKSAAKGGGGDYRMRDYPTNPVMHCKNSGIQNIFRFILTHPDMDHMDGLKALHDCVSIGNFWDCGVRRDKPAFDGGPYQEADWDHHVKLRDKKHQPYVPT